MLLVVALISALILAWAKEWRVELKLASNFKTSQRSRRLAEAGIYYALGKMMAARLAAAAPGTDAAAENSWQGDQSPHLLEFAEGKAEVRVADEGGKINLNTAPDAALRALFIVLGVSEPRLSVMVDSIMDWRSKGEQPRPYGAKSDYYLTLTPPYVAKLDKFDGVEELAWVRGFEAYPLLPRLGDWLTVHQQKGLRGNTVNLNTAPMEVLEAVGYTQEKAQTLIEGRHQQSGPNRQETAPASRELTKVAITAVATRPSPFMTITAIGQAKGQEGQYAIKAIVQMEAKGDKPWQIVSWYDGFPIN